MAAMLLMTLLCGCGDNGAEASDTPETTETTGDLPEKTEAPVSVSPNSQNEETQWADLTDHTLSVYCGAGMTKPFQDIADAFQDETDCTVEVTFANAAQIQTQINTAMEGDLFIAGSSDELAPVKDVVTESVDLVKHVPVLAVISGNPLGITGIADLAGEGVRVVLGDAESTPIGKIANKALTDAGILEKVDVVSRTTTAPAIFNALLMEECDAIIVWKENITDPAVEIVNAPEMENYIKTVPAASLSYCDDEQARSEFLKFLDSDMAKDIWINYGYDVLN